MQLKELELLHRLGQITQARVSPNHDIGWLLEVHLEQGYWVTMEKARPPAEGETTNPRIFRTVDAAVSAASAIGLSVISVTVPAKEVPKAEDFRLR